MDRVCNVYSLSELPLKEKTGSPTRSSGFFILAFHISLFFFLTKSQFGTDFPKTRCIHFISHYWLHTNGQKAPELCKNTFTFYSQLITFSLYLNTILPKDIFVRSQNLSVQLPTFQLFIGSKENKAFDPIMSAVEQCDKT